MISNEEVSQLIEVLSVDTQSMLNKLDSMKAIDETHRLHIKLELAELVFSGLLDARDSLNGSKESGDFITPLITAAIAYGMIAGQFGLGKFISKQKSDYGRQRQLGTPKQEALDKIAQAFHLAQDKFKERNYGAKFIREMGDKYPEITDIGTIQKHVRKLKKASAS